MSYECRNCFSVPVIRAVGHAGFLVCLILGGFLIVGKGEDYNQPLHTEYRETKNVHVTQIRRNWFQLHRLNIGGRKCVKERGELDMRSHSKLVDCLFNLLKVYVIRDFSAVCTARYRGGGEAGRRL